MKTLQHLLAGIARVRTFLATRPGLSSLGGLALLLGFIPLCVLLAVTIIGIPLIPVAVMLLIAVLLFGITVSALWLGERIPLLRENKTPLKAVALGGAVFVVVGLIPWIGTLAIFLAALVAAGAALLSRFGRRVEGALGSPTGA
jgi:O-antigen/teichoic acid export membrane protein